MSPGQESSNTCHSEYKPLYTLLDNRKETGEEQFLKSLVEGNYCH